MSISWKNTTTLVNNFLKNPSEFESYVKGCLNSISKINYLKETQFDETVDDYNYFKCLSGAIAFDVYLSLINKEYRKETLKLIPNERMINVKTNIFYVDRIRSFFERLDNSSTQDSKEECHFSRMVCTVFINQSQFGEKNGLDCTSIEKSFQSERVYTLNELFNLFKDNIISIVDNHVESDDISEEELRYGLRNGFFVLQEANLNCIGFDNKVHADYVSCKNEYDRMIWYMLYSCFLRYIRKEKIYCSDTFDNNQIGYNLSWYFYETTDQLEDIFSKIKSNFRKKKKKLPNNYARIIQEGLSILDIEKRKFQSTSQKKGNNKALIKQLKT